MLTSKPKRKQLNADFELPSTLGNIQSKKERPPLPPRSVRESVQTRETRRSSPLQSQPLQSQPLQSQTIQSQTIQSQTIQSQPIQQEEIKQEKSLNQGNEKPITAIIDDQSRHERIMATFAEIKVMRRSIIHRNCWIP